MDLYNQTLAGAIGKEIGHALPTGRSTAEYFRVQFYTLTIRAEDELDPEITWVPAVKCEEYYKDEMENDPVLKDEFGNTDWICPDPESKQFEILNYPNLYTRGNGLSFNMVINTCAEATKINQAQGFADYSTTD